VIRVTWSPLTIALTAAGAMVLYALLRGADKAGSDTGKVAGAVGTAAGKFAIEFGAGLVRGGASVVGVPDPASKEAQSQCCKALVEPAGLGKSWRVMSYCSVPVAVDYIKNGKRPNFCPGSGGATGNW
jgi:hypothetical protein